MHLSRFLKISVTATALLLVTSLSFAAAQPMTSTNVVADPASMQAALTKLQQQMQQISDDVPQKLAAQDAANQKAVTNLQQQMQAQIAHLQTEIQQLQAQTSKEIAQVQTEVQQGAKK